MKIAIISDIHGNLEALQAVVEDLKSQDIGVVYCLGDVVGYGPDPLKCLGIVSSLCQKMIKGNHEECVCNAVMEKELNLYAIEGVRYARKNLSEEAIKAIANLPHTINIPELDMVLCHGSFSEPSLWNYIDAKHKAREELKITPSRICLVGHTHNPFVFGSKNGLYEFLTDDMVLDKDQKFIVNVGSVGQPRDGDCRACYGIFDFGDNVTFTLRRVFYNIAKTESAIKYASLSSYLSDRLFKGA